MKHAAPIAVAGLLLAIVVTALAQEHRNPVPPPKPWRSRNYEVLGNLPATEARPIVAHMDAVFEEYERRFASFPAKNSSSVRLFLFDTNENYFAKLAERGVKADNTAGIFFWSSQEVGLSTFLEGQSGLRMFHTLQHEGFHQFAYIRIGSSLPIWANEGVAEYFGQAILVKGKLKTGVAPESRIERIREEIRNEISFPLEELLTISHERWNMAVSGGDVRAGVLYDQSWSVIHFLINAENGKYADALQTYIRTAATGAAPEQAMIKAFGSADAAKAMDQKWRDWALNDWKADPLSTAAERLEFLGEGIKAVAAKGLAFTSIDELKAHLRAMKFALRRVDHGIMRELAATDDRLFEAPVLDDARPGRKAPAMELAVPKTTKGGPRLPEIRVTGLPAIVRLEWSGDDADPRPEVVFE